MEHELLQRITINPDICHGKPTIRNKRYPVENLLELMASGMTGDEILADYEDLEKADLDACLMFPQDQPTHDLRNTTGKQKKLPFRTALK